MNQPTEDRIKKLEEEQKQLKEEVRQLREQITEPIRIDRLEIDRGGTQELLKETNKKLEQIIQTQTDRSERFDILERSQQELKQELHTISETWLDTLQEHYTEHQEAISDVKTVQSGHSKFFEEHGKRLAATATKEDVNQLETTMATKDDIKNMATKDDISTIETRLDKIEGLIMQLIQQNRPES